jgi:hypothetical protein
MELTGVELLEKLAALVAPPRAHLLRYHGILAPHAKGRKQGVPPERPRPEEACGHGAPKEASAEGEAVGKPRRGRRKRTPWAELLRRSFGIDVLNCPRCGDRMTPPPPRPVEPESRPAPPPPPPRRPKGDTGIKFLTEPTGASKGECQVCSTAMTVDLVACAKCRTLHHRSCWGYVGRCSTYACGCTRSAPAGPEGPPGEAVEVHGGPGGTVPNRVLRDWMRKVAVERGWGEVRALEKKKRHCEVGFKVGRLDCRFVGRKQGNFLDFQVRVELSGPGERASVEEYVGQVRTPSIRRTFSDQQAVFSPARSVDSLARLRTFVDGALDLVGNLARRP